MTSLMVTASDTNQIMQLLALRYGNASAVAGHKLQKLKKLPWLNGVNADLITFAITVKNCVVEEGIARIR